MVEENFEFPLFRRLIIWPSIDSVYSSWFQKKWTNETHKLKDITSWSWKGTAWSQNRSSKFLTMVKETFEFSSFRGTLFGLWFTISILPISTEVSQERYIYKFSRWIPSPSEGSELTHFGLQLTNITSNVRVDVAKKLSTALRGGQNFAIKIQLMAAGQKRLLAIFHNFSKIIVKKYYCKDQHQKWGRVNQKWGIAPFATPWLRYCFS